jgi:hypothetical protein
MENDSRGEAGWSIAFSNERGRCSYNGMTQISWEDFDWKVTKGPFSLSFVSYTLRNIHPGQRPLNKSSSPISLDWMIY